MEENKEKDIEAIFLATKDYVNTRIEYTRLSLVEKSSKLLADLITSLTVIICFTLAFLFGTCTLALYLSAVLGTYTKGFGAVALIYLALALLVFLAKKKFIEKYLVNFFIKKYFEKLADKDDDEN